MKVNKDSSTLVLWLALVWNLIQLAFCVCVLYIIATVIGEILVRIAERV